jgi:hypothetical protein
MVSKKSVPAAATVRVTGTVMVAVGVGYEVKTICPVYVPAASVTTGFTVAVTTAGVKQQPVPLGEICSHVPPVFVVAVAVKRVTEALVMVTPRTCGKGLEPANTLVKESAGMVEKVWASNGVAEKTASPANASRERADFIKAPLAELPTISPDPVKSMKTNRGKCSEIYLITSSC